MYAELHSWSNFTFLEGGSHPEELADRAAELGLAALALTDRDGLYGSIRFAGRAKLRGLAAIVGSELTFDDGARIVLLVEDERGYANLCELISRAQLRGRKGDARLQLDDVTGRADGLIALSGGPDGRVERALAAYGPAHAAGEIRRLRELFGERFHLELQQHLTEEEARRNQCLVQLSRELHVPCVATNAVAYAGKEDAYLTDLLRCVKGGTNLARARTEHLLRPNAEFYLKSAAAMRRLFRPHPEAIARTVEIAARCRFRLERITGQFPLFPVEEGKTRQSYLRELVYRGAAQRYGTPLESNVERQLEYELGIIARMDLAGYFLIVWDIVQEAGRLGVLCQGRGSAANSAVCYALGITAVDPIGMQLLFERFMSEERREIPDIDIDFAHQDREKVIQYVYTRYGRSNAAMTAEVITYHARSALRDVGKALGFTLEEVEKLAQELNATESLEKTVILSGTPPTPVILSGTPPTPVILSGTPPTPVILSGTPPTPVILSGTPPTPVILSGTPEGRAVEGRAVEGRAVEARLLAVCKRLENFPRHMGIHSGGMVLTRDPLVRVAPVEWATMRDRTIIQWDKDDLQELGLIKIDLLGLGMLSLLREAFSLHKRCHGSELALHAIPANDPPTYAMIQRADTVGVFQIESRAQQSMLPRMKPACFYDIVMQVAIIRPGPIQGQMVHPFLRRRAGLEPITYPHPKLKPVLERTMGVPLFQEQGMRMAIEAAGFSPGEADQLRRAMGHKRSRKRMLEIYPRLVDGMVANGIDRAAAEQLFHMLEGFADYGFPESHAASFALLAYASSYVKCRFPAIFAAAILNVQPMGFYSTEVLVNDARRHGVVVKSIEVNASEYWSHVDSDGALRLGFHLIRGLGEAQRTHLERALHHPPCPPERRREAPQSKGAFANLLDFAQRTQLEKEAIENLAIAGAFKPWFGSRREAMWALRALDEREARGELGKLMDVAEPAVRFKTLAPKQETAFDLWSTGVTPQGQAMMHFRKQLDAQRVITAARLAEMPPNLLCRVGGLVITRQRPGTAKGFVFLTLEDETGLVNVIVRPDVYERYRRTIRSASMLVIDGKLQKESGCIDLIAHHIHAFDSQGIAKAIPARNFR